RTEPPLRTVPATCAGDARGSCVVRRPVGRAASGSALAARSPATRRRGSRRRTRARAARSSRPRELDPGPVRGAHPRGARARPRGAIAVSARRIVRTTLWIVAGSLIASAWLLARRAEPELPRTPLAALLGPSAVLLADVEWIRFARAVRSGRE